MRKHLFIVLTLILLFSCNNKVKSLQSVVNDNHEKSYKVYKIDSINNYYLIYLNDKQYNYKVVSEKADNINCREKIKVNRKYRLELVSITRSMLGDHFLSYHHLGGITLGNTLIRIERENSIIDLYYAKNIKGLCIVDECVNLEIW